MVICLQRGADLHMAQMMPLALTVSCFSKIQIGFTSLVPAHPGSPGPLNGCVCVLDEDVAGVCCVERRADAVRQRSADGHQTSRTLPALPRLPGTPTVNFVKPSSQRSRTPKLDMGWVHP